MSWTVRGSNPGWGEISRTHPDRSWGPTRPLVQWVPGTYPGVEGPGRGADHPYQSNAEANTRVCLYLESLSGPSCPVLGWTLPFFPYRLTLQVFISERYAIFNSILCLAWSLCTSVDSCLSWNTDFANLIASHLVKIFASFHRSRKFINIFKKSVTC
jgi:hypothetical protein